MKNKKKVEDFVPDFIQIPYQLIADPDLNSVERVLYGVITFFAKMKEKKCFATNVTLASLIFTSPNNVSRSVKKLQEKGYILVTYVDPVTKRNRKEIIPLVTSQTAKKSEIVVNPASTSTPRKRLFPQDSRNNPVGLSRQSYKANEENTEKMGVLKSETIEIKGFSGTEDANDDRPVGLQRNKGIENTDREDISFLAGTPSEIPTENGDLVEKFKDQLAKKTLFGNTSEIPAILVSDTIALFLPVFPGEFVNKNPFANTSTRNAVKRVLMVATPEQIKKMIERYLASETDKYRPDASSIYNFCQFKFEKIQAYAKKSESGLWAQKSISTPEQRAESDKLINKRLEDRREKQKRNREEWAKNNPTK